MKSLIGFLWVFEMSMLPVQECISFARKTRKLSVRKCSKFLWLCMPFFPKKRQGMAVAKLAFALYTSEGCEPNHLQTLDQGVVVPLQLQKSQGSYRKNGCQNNSRMIQEATCATRLLSLHFVHISHLGWHNFWCSTNFASSKNAIPQTSNGSEGIVAAFMTFMVPIMVMWHLGKGKKPLQLMGEVQTAAHTCFSRLSRIRMRWENQKVLLSSGRSTWAQKCPIAALPRLSSQWSS